MRYEKFSPSPPLAQFVECYFTWESLTPKSEGLVVESPPNSFCSIVFNYADPYYLTNKKYSHVQVPKAFLSGPSIYLYSLHLSGNIGMAGIVFKPAALATIFNLPMFEYIEERAPLDKVFQPAFVSRMFDDIAHAADNRARVKFLDDFMLKEINMRRPQPDYIDAAANFILDCNGMLQVSDLLKESFMSRRTFERKFFQKVGLSPKYFARIRRIGHLCNLVAGRKKVDWAAIFYQCEYYDQAHFIRDFEEFTGRTPGQYLKENVELANWVPKPKQQQIE